MTRSSTATSDASLAHLRALLEVNGQIARARHDLRLEGRFNEDVRSVLDHVTRNAAVHRDELGHLIREWERAGRGDGPAADSQQGELISSRELIESWLAIKESSMEIYRAAAADAPNALIRRRLQELAHEDEVQAERLRRLL